MMKKVLLSLLSLLALPCFAQVQCTAEFDFGNPLGLNPPVTPGDYLNAKVNVFNKVFTDNGVSMSFSSAVSHNGGAQILTNTVNGTTYSLRITSGTLITFAVADGATIQEITLSEDSYKGDLSVANGSVGTLIGKTWTCGDNSVSSVSFFTDGGSEWKLVTVKYIAPQNVLVPSVNLPAQVETFKSVNLVFDSPMSIVSTSGITISGTGITSLKALDVSVSGRIVTLSLPGNEVLNTDGDFLIVVPEGSFKDGQGYRNTSLSYQFSVYEPRNTLQCLSITPACGKQEALPEEILLEFNKAVKVPEGTAFDLELNGEYEATLTDVSVPAEQPYFVSIKTFPIKKYGDFTITIPEGAIHTTAYGTSSAAANDRWNKNITISYTIDEPVDPLKELKAEVRSLKNLINSAIGYPASGSAAETAINDALEAIKDGTELTIEEQKSALEAAVAVFYAETDVVMPAGETWYNFKGVNKTGQVVYLGYSGGKVTVVTDKSNAAAFLAIPGDDYYTFQTADGKFLTVLPTVTDAVANINQLKLQKLLVEDVDNKELIGLFSIYGWQGRAGAEANYEDLGNAYETVNYGSNTLTGSETTVFNSALSSAFTFISTKDPTIIDPIEPVATLSPTSMLTTQTTALLTFTNLTKVGLADATKPYFSKDIAGNTPVNQSTAAHILTPNQFDQNAFDVHLDGLGAGIYYLVLPKGTFDYSQNDKPVIDRDMAYQFSLTEPESHFNATYNNYSVLQVIDRNTRAIDVIADVDLNDLVIMAQVPKNYSDLVPDPAVRIEIVNTYYLSDVVGYGHFEPYTNAQFKKDYPQYAHFVTEDGYKAIKLVMDTPLTAGSLEDRPDTYSYHIPEAAFGDAKFKDFMAGKAGVKKEHCIVNPEVYAPSFYVDNNRTAISTVSADAAKDKVIYDLQGRRVTNATKKGVYVVNGRKVVIR